MINNLMNFKLFFEARDEFIKKIQSAIDKVDDRPFNELFGNKDRFLVKVYNPKFQRPIEYFDLNIDGFDFNKRTYKGIPIYKFLKTKTEAIRKRYEHETEEIRYGKMYKRKIEEFKNSERGKDLILHTIKAISMTNPKFEYWTGDTVYQLKGQHREDIGVISAKEAEKLGLPKLGETFDRDDVAKYINGILDNEHLSITFGGFLINSLLDARTEISDAINHMDEMHRLGLEQIKKLKQAIDQNDIYYYLLFSRHPIDVLRMADHKGISSCHRLQGKYSETAGIYHKCAIADAQNDGGIVYLIKKGEANKVRAHLNDADIFIDKDRDVGIIQPSGRIRLRRFIDIETGKDFAVPTTLMSEQKYGYFTKEIYDDMLEYLREHQNIYTNRPTSEYMEKNVVMVGGEYSDESLSQLLINFFGENSYGYLHIKHKNKEMVDWNAEMDNIIDEAEHMSFKFVSLGGDYTIENNRIDVPIYVHVALPSGLFKQELWDKLIKIRQITHYYDNGGLEIGIAGKDMMRLTAISSTLSIYRIFFNMDIKDPKVFMRTTMNFYDPEQFSEYLFTLRAMDDAMYKHKDTVFKVLIDLLELRADNVCKSLGACSKEFLDRIKPKN